MIAATGTPQGRSCSLLRYEQKSWLVDMALHPCCWTSPCKSSSALRKDDSPAEAESNINKVASSGRCTSCQL